MESKPDAVTIWQVLRPALSGLAAAAMIAACHRHSVSEDVVQPPPTNDNRRVEQAPADPAIAALFRDTAPSNAFVPAGRDYNVQKASDRQALQAALKTERALWQAVKPREYRVLTRSDCFCPGPRGWVLIEVRPNQPLRAWDSNGRRVNPGDWYTFTIDNLYDNLERINNQQSQVQIAFDERWHYPRYLRTSMIYPDGWGITQIRGFQPRAVTP
ncbi:MAG TPA: DUF6174 domain-containing protein [Gemmatimonadaceae bacterium]|nr:DUF6174 domain-containing protein [Gemmatimonadaceae bacterium]